MRNYPESPPPDFSKLQFDEITGEPVGDDLTGNESYIGWILQEQFGDDIRAFFVYSSLYEPDYLFMLDSSLMMLSRGGISLDKLEVMGPRSKDSYLRSLIKIEKARNQPSTSGSHEVETRPPDLK